MNELQKKLNEKEERPYKSPKTNLVRFFVIFPTIGLVRIVRKNTSPKEYYPNDESLGRLEDVMNNAETQDMYVSLVSNFNKRPSIEVYVKE